MSLPIDEVARKDSKAVRSAMRARTTTGLNAIFLGFGRRSKIVDPFFDHAFSDNGGISI
jgi:hypothetical protein